MGFRNCAASTQFTFGKLKMG
ncbi:hypothetical protein CCACVL1_28246 [Corchorus capsularis]|uniref:Uncharacterized protein n=1 Tax=Corchorus capsularis TaxID=210143 RepID=A0A1R3G738_COCAP|nr:hypothetical protein CCACVL1_28246 [Corchorus capsularis]